MKRLLLVLTVLALYILHQDFWFWRRITPLIFGFLPIGLFYHVCYTLAVSLLMWLLVKYTWPSYLEESAGELWSRRAGEERDSAGHPNPQPANRNPQSEGPHS